VDQPEWCGYALCVNVIVFCEFDVCMLSGVNVRRSAQNVNMSLFLTTIRFLASDVPWQQKQLLAWNSQTCLQFLF